LELRFEKEFEDVRGKILFLSRGSEKIHFIDTKKGFARGGHYRKIEYDIFIISGKLEYREENEKTGQEQIKTVTAPVALHVFANTANLFIAVENTLLVETFKEESERVNYLKYRKIVEESISSK
jgi:hypothetical protein